MLLDQKSEIRIFERKIDALRKRDFIPADLINLVEKVLREQIKARCEAKPTPSAGSGLASAEKRAQGAPLLQQSDFPFDQAQARRLFLLFMDAMKAGGNALARAGEILGQALKDKELDLDQAFEAYLNSKRAYFDSWGERTPDAPRGLSFLVKASMTPSLAAAADKIKGELGSDQVWRFGHCPVCGGLPLIGELKEKQGFRHLTCSFCLHEYRVKRIGCPLCDESDAEKLSFFKSEDEPGYRVYACQSCMTYIKTIDFREMDRESLPLLDDLDSLSLDIMAAGMGYKRPTLSGWGF